MAPNFLVALKRFSCHFWLKNEPREPARDTVTPDPIQSKAKRWSMVELSNKEAPLVKPRRMSLTLNHGIFSKRRRSSEITFLEPAFPPEIIEKIASFMTQHDLCVFSRASRDAYTAAERYLYRRPFTRRFDKLLRTLERSPYKADFILELALGFETDFYSVK
jgi:F-box-like